MKIEDLVALAKAGYTPEQVAALLRMAAPETPTDAAPAPTPAPVEEPAPAPAPVEKAAPAPAPAHNVDDLFAEMQRLAGVIQAGNIAGSQAPAPATADEVLAQILDPNPPTNK